MLKFYFNFKAVDSYIRAKLNRSNSVRNNFTETQKEMFPVSLIRKNETPFL